MIVNRVIKNKLLSYVRINCPALLTFSIMEVSG